MQAEQPRVLAVVAHNLGDAVITSSFLKRMIEAVPHAKWDVWCRPDVAFLFQRLSDRVEVTVNRFPVGTNKQLTVRAFLALIASIFRFRRRSFSLSFDLLGDFRDVALGRLAGGQVHISPVWETDHPLAQITRPSPSRWIHHPVAISSTTPSIYAAYETICAEITGKLGGRLRSLEVAATSQRGTKPCVGFHPFASQECKLWPSEYWRALAGGLQERGWEVQAFSAPSERGRLAEVFGGSLPDGALISESLPRFVERVAELNLLIGLDSFSVHVAHMVGVRSIMLNGANDPRVWAPASCEVITEPVGCGNQPCLNKPSCVGTAYQYSCMVAISPARVISTVEATMRVLRASEASVVGRAP